LSFHDRFDDLKLLKPVIFTGKEVLLLDQTKLPETEKYLKLKNCGEVAKAIKTMKVRGGGAIMLAAVYGLALSAINSRGNLKILKKDAEILKNTRPTAAALFQAIDFILRIAEKSSNVAEDVQQAANWLFKKTVEMEIKVGENGSKLFEDGDTVLTHCNAGALAAAGYGGVTLSVFRKCREKGKKIKVFVTETRPYLQGARLTLWELKKFGFDAVLITDNAVGYCMQKGMIDKVLVGADRIAANGDVANKVGTYLIALAAKKHKIPFYVSGTIDPKIKTGDEIKIEIRSPEEVLIFNGKRIAPKNIEVFYPAFDITPHQYVTAIITKDGVFKPPYNFGG